MKNVMRNVMIKTLAITSLLLLLTAITLILPVPRAVADTGGLKIEGAIINREVTPGEEFAHKMTISLGTGNPAMDITVETRGLGQRTDGSYLELTPQEDNLSLSSRTFIVTISPPSFHLDPGSSQVVTASIEVPGDIGDGSRYAVIYIRGVPTQQAVVAFMPAIDVPVIITHGNLDIQGDITDLSAQDVISGAPITIATTLTNQGNHHFKAVNSVTMKDGTGRVLAAGAELSTPCSIIPGYAYVFNNVLVIPGDIEPGTYYVQSVVKMDNGTGLTEEMTLNLTERYQPQVTPSAIARTRQAQPTQEPVGISWAFVGITIGGIAVLGTVIIVVSRRRRD
jgi:hypothetical protein